MDQNGIRLTGTNADGGIKPRMMRNMLAASIVLIVIGLIVAAFWMRG